MFGGSMIGHIALDIRGIKRREDREIRAGTQIIPEQRRI